MTICPECSKSTGRYRDETAIRNVFRWMNYPLYQRSYPGEPLYISERCELCYDMAVLEM